MGNYLKDKLLRPIGRRGFIGSAITSLLGGLAIFKGGLVTSSAVKETNKIVNNLDFTLPGKLGHPDLLLLMDPRLDHRIAGWLMKTNERYPAQMPDVTMDMDYDQVLKFIDYMHGAVTSTNKELFATMPAFKGVQSREYSIQGDGGHEIKLFVDSPKTKTSALPCLVHMHGGGMTFDTAKSAANIRWRKSLAEQGLVVVGVEFRNEALSPGHQPFPAGLNDCASSVRWANDNREHLGISSIILIGESGGGNLAVATGIKANRDGWVDIIDGVYAMAPMLFGFYGKPPPDLMSWRENLDLMGSYAAVRAFRMAYDPHSAHENNPMAYPFSATKNDLRGLPPHILHNYELDLIRDEGVVFAQKLRAAGVEATSKIINGSHHVPELAMPDVIPELTRDTLASITAFAQGVQSRR